MDQTGVSPHPRPENSAERGNVALSCHRAVLSNVSLGLQDGCFTNQNKKEYTMKKACKKTTAALAAAFVATALLATGTGCVSKSGSPYYWDNSVNNSKRGSATQSVILGLFNSGDASIEEAMRDGRIEKIHHIDYHDMKLFGGLIYWQRTLHAYGE